MTLIEVLVGVALSSVVLAAAVSVAFSSRNLYTHDRTRTDLNQNLRAGLDVVGLDLRRLGERLPTDFPALEIMDGGSGPDTLVIRRNVSDAVLPVCGDIVAGTTVGSIEVAKTGTPGCSPVADKDANGWPDNIDEWRVERSAKGGDIPVYVFNPVYKFGEFVRFDADDNNKENLAVSGTTSWQYSYSPGDQSRMYLLSQQSYQIQSGTLMFVPDDGSTNPVKVVPDVVDFQIRAVHADGSVADSHQVYDDWSSLEAIEITLTGRTTAGSKTIERTVSTRFFPRNVLSL